MSEILLKDTGNDRRDRHDACMRCIAKISLAGEYIDGNKAVRDSELEPSHGVKDAFEISKILGEYVDESIVINGSPGVGKSTIAQHLEVVDMDIMFDTMPTELKRHLLHHEYYLDGDQNSTRVKKRTIPFRQDASYITDLTKTTRQLSLYAEEFLKNQLAQGITLIGTTPIHADKVILLKADGEDLLRNAELRSYKTTREIDFQRTLYIDRLIEKITREIFAEEDVIVYNMQYE